MSECGHMRFRWRTPLAIPARRADGHNGGGVTDEADRHAISQLRERLAFLEAMSIVIERRQEPMEVVGSADDGETARRAVMRHFGFEETQSYAVLELPVRRFCDS